MGRLSQSLFCLTAVVVLATLHQHFWTDAGDACKCGALLTTGHWLDRLNNSTQSPPTQWQPQGCMMHQYQPSEIAECTRGRKIQFIGDSTTRQIFWATASKLNRTDAEVAKLGADKHADMTYIAKNVTLEFIWDPFLNRTNFSDDNETAVTLVGGGLWFTRSFEEGALLQYRSAMQSMIRTFQNSGRCSNEKDQGPPPINSSSLFLTPVHEPLYELLSPPRKASITPDKLHKMNTYLAQVANTTLTPVIWSYARMMNQSNASYANDGLHVSEAVASRQADVLLNVNCNGQRAQQGGFPNDGTCCACYCRPNITQYDMLAMVLGSIVGNILARVIEHFWHKFMRKLPTSDAAWACFTILSAVCLCYITDRTQIFAKVHKHYANLDFVVMCSVALVVGLVSVRRSKPGTQQPFLSRHQSEEWKGWMQFVILIYHYTGASKILHIYQVIRLLVASYLFMTGYGHTLYFLEKRDYSFRRAAAVLIRLNVLACILPYMMRTNYLFYYFAPLTSFWFLVVYFTLRIGHSNNNRLWFVLGKIVISACLVTILHTYQGPLDFGHRHILHGDLREWRFRVMLDRYIVYVGMLVAVFVSRSTSHPVQNSHTVNQTLTIEKPKSSDMERCSGVVSPLQTRRQSFVRKCRTAALIVLSTIVLLSYAAFARTITSKQTYNSIHPYISFLPILAFLLLRNATPTLRNFHSHAFAWLGRCSLETFTLQFHIWLAADTKGLLSTGLFRDGEDGEAVGRVVMGGARWKDFLLLTPVFLWVCWCVAGATGRLTRWIVGDERGGKGAKGEVLHGGVRCEVDTRWLGLRGWFAKMMGDLRVRVGLMLGLLWVLNMVGRG